MTAEIKILPNPPTVAGCPNVPLPDVGDVVSWAGASAALQSWAAAQLHYPLGTVIRDAFEGQPVIVRIECHFAYGAHPELPGKWHKGASVFRPARRNESGKLVAILEVPAGWPTSGRDIT